MDPQAKHPDDGQLRTQILAGLTAIAELEARYRQPLERFLVGLCDRSDGRSQEKSVEIAGQILADCFVKKPSLLERWQGPDNLEAFLRTAAKNRLKSWWSSAEKRRTDVDSESLALKNLAGAPTSSDRDELDLAEKALRNGVNEAGRKCPEGLVFMRLKGLHGVDQRLISQCWGHHEAQTSRRIREAMEIIRTCAVEMAAKEGCALSMDLLHQAIQRNPAILLGDDQTRDTETDYGFLKRLSEGGADTHTKKLAIEQMYGDPQMLKFFAESLTCKDVAKTLVVRDPQLSGMSARLDECIRRSLEIFAPSDAGGLVTPVMSDGFADLLNHVGADGGTLWMLCQGAAALEAVFNPLEPEIAGKRQPLVSGIVSLVLATGETICVSGPAAHHSHSPAIDIALGKNTHAMIAAPFVLAGAVRGVLTAVRLKHDEPFSEMETRMVHRHSEILAVLMLRELVYKILG